MILHGDCLEKLKSIEDNSIDCCVTSPPYWGLRDYGVEGQLGLEKTPYEYVDSLVKVFIEIRRVLKKEGTLWLNLGDTYCGGGNNRGSRSDFKFSTKQATNRGAVGQVSKYGVRSYKSETIKPKDLVGIPWRVAFALQENGWYLRQDIIWHKTNPMPESVKDRCTKSHEYIFLFSKSRKYYFDSENIKENSNGSKPAGNKISRNMNKGRINKEGWSFDPAKSVPEFRNRRSVWTVATKPFKGAHFATFPEALIEPCILAGCPVNGTVLDPFMGSGTVAVVSKKHNRKWLGIELKKEYVEIIQRRLDAE